jgi:3-deoxy-manno-octulosonate cytidylyltransferase (CMP-KDO synthetase)
MMQFNNWLLVIPARLSSERLPRKPLQRLGGRYLIEQVYHNLKALTAHGVEIVVACDSKDVEQVCLNANIPTVMTKASHPSGTDRCNEVAKQRSKSFILNVQGDEPFVELEDLKRLMIAVETTKSPMGTLGFRSKSRADFENPNHVKIVRSSTGHALYFSRAPIPCYRDYQKVPQPDFSFYQHVGVYGFSKDSLSEFCALPQSPLETIEKLEQLRAVEAGWRILVCETQNLGFGIDTPEDLTRAENFLKSRAAGSGGGRV